MSGGCSIAGAALAALAAALVAAPGRAESELDTEHERTLYALGMRCGNQLVDFALRPGELPVIEQGLRDVVSFRPAAVNAGAYRSRIRQLREERRPAAVAAEAEASRAFVERAADESGALRVEPGFVYAELRPGRGRSPGAGDTVRVHFHGRLRDGSVFDSSVERGTPIQVRLDRMFPCWREGVARMRVGGKSRLVCPPETAYGDEGTPRVPGGAALDLEIELLGIVRPSG